MFLKMLHFKIFIKKYGINATSNFDLMKIAKELKIPNFHVCMRDEVSSIKSLKSYHVVVNLHTSHEDGIQWGCFTPNYFFDSYGLPPTNEVKDVMQHGEYNTFQIQTPGTKLCGQLCLFVLYHLHKKKPFIEILLDLREDVKFHTQKL